MANTENTLMHLHYTIFGVCYVYKLYFQCVTCVLMGLSLLGLVQCLTKQQCQVHVPDTPTTSTPCTKGLRKKSLRNVGNSTIYQTNIGYDWSARVSSRY